MLQATKEPPQKKDFVETREQYLKTLNINVTFVDIGQMSKFIYENLVKEKTKESAFNYLFIELVRFSNRSCGSFGPS